MTDRLNRRHWLAASPAMAVSSLLASPTPSTAAPLQRSDETSGGRENRVVVSPAGPHDGGDFGPQTPGTRTSGLQEAFDAAKSERKDLYVSGGSWTLGKNQPVVYFLHETLKIPWMQDFRMDGGHAVIQYTPATGDAIHIDSQMSCSYRFGIISSNSSGAVVRLGPESAGPDRFKVITSTDFHFNALVGSGGAWPGGEAFNSQLDQGIRRVGTGLWLDGRSGSIDANTIEVTEIVGCERGLYVAAASTHNWIRAANIHLCHQHLVVGDPDDPRPNNNTISGYLNSEGIQQALGAGVAGTANRLELIFGQMSEGQDLVLEPTAEHNLISATQFPHGFSVRATRPNNRVLSNDLAKWFPGTPAVPESGQWALNGYVAPVEIRLLDSGNVQRWSERTADGPELVVHQPLLTGQTLLLNPGDALSFTYEQPPTWRWKVLG